MALVIRKTMASGRRLLEAGQSVLEYAILFAVVSAAFLAMSQYVKRALQGKINVIEQKTVAQPYSEPQANVWVPPI